MKTIYRLLPGAVFAALAAMVTTVVQAEDIKLRIASGHPAANTYVNLMQNFFVPEVTKRVAAKTKHKLEFIEGYGGSMVKTADTLEGVQSGIIDIGGYCFCFEPSNLPLHAFQVMLPFGTMDPVMSLKTRARGLRQGPLHVEGARGQVPADADRADRRQRFTTSAPRWSGTTSRISRAVKLAGAGLNLKWLEFAGATCRCRVLAGGGLYRSMQTGVYNGWIMFPSGWVNFKLYEVGKYYTEVGFGAITWHGLTVNSAKFAKLPKEVQDIIAEVAREYEAKTGSVNKENYPKQVEQLKGLGTNIKSVPATVKLDWANSLKDWPQQKAAELDKQGLPATQVLKLALEEAEKLGHKWPVRYAVK